MSNSKGLVVNVLRNTLGDSTNGGVSATNDTFVLTGEGVDCQVFTPSEEMPELVLFTRMMGDTEYLHAVPKELEHRHTMFGGNFVYTSDSRFPSNQPIKIHDRVE